MNRSLSWRAAMLLGLGIAAGIVGGCAARAPAAPTSVAPTATSVAAATATPAPPEPTPTEAAATPTPEPVPTFATTWELTPEPPRGAVTVEMAYVESRYVFDPTEITVPSGDVVFFLRNVPYLTVDHQFSVGPNTRVEQAESPAVNAGDSGVLTIADLPAGTYRFWCRLGGHYLLGMVGTLTVTP